jgi:hypothetical protein
MSERIPVLGAFAGGKVPDLDAFPSTFAHQGKEEVVSKAHRKDGGRNPKYHAAQNDVAAQPSTNEGQRQTHGTVNDREV